MVPGLRHCIAAARRRCRHTLSGRHNRLDAVFGWLLVFASGVDIAQAVMVGHWVGFFDQYWPRFYWRYRFDIRLTQQIDLAPITGYAA